MKNYQDKIAVITGGGSGFGLEVARIGAARGMKLVLADVQQDALDRAKAELEGLGAKVLAMRVDVSKFEDIQALADATVKTFGVPNFVFNNAGVGAGGFVWEQEIADWQWLIGVNLWGVIYGVKAFTQLMLDAAARDPSYEGHIVNTASMAGLLTAPNMGIYNVTKHGVVALTETLYQDLSFVTDQVHCSVLCPYFVPTGIAQSHRNRPTDLKHVAPPTKSQKVAQAMIDKSVNSGRVSAKDVAGFIFAAMDENKFYIYSHPKALGNVERRMRDIVDGKNPGDPFEATPHVRQNLIEALKS